VDAPASSWCVLEEQQQPGTPAAAGAPHKRRPGKLLHVSLVLPEPTEEEMQYKKGESASRCCSCHASFADAPEFEFNCH
jgi:hypothetical protein